MTNGHNWMERKEQRGNTSNKDFFKNKNNLSLFSLYVSSLTGKGCRPKLNKVPLHVKSYLLPNEILKFQYF